MKSQDGRRVSQASFRSAAAPVFDHARRDQPIASDGRIARSEPISHDERIAREERIARGELTGRGAKGHRSGSPSVWGVLSLALVLAGLQAGCSETESIRRYRVPKPPHRMLAAISIQGADAWFFKVTGGREELATKNAEFEAFLKSVRLPGAAGAPGADASGTKPTWTLPDGWKEATSATGERVATIEIPGKDKPFELTVTRLPFTQRSVEQYQQQNINRWRTQLRLGPMMPGDWDKETRQLAGASGNQLTVVNFVGTLPPPGQRPGGMGMGGMGMAGMGGAAGPDGGEDVDDSPRSRPPGAVRAPREGGSADLPFTFTAPSEWQSAPVGPFAKLTYRIANGGETGEITVSSLSASANDLLANVNRWRGQVQLPPWMPAELTSQVRVLQLGAAEGSYVDLDGAGTSGQSILGAIAVHGDSAWFFKFKGPAPLVARERERFEAFMKSVRFKPL